MARHLVSSWGQLLGSLPEAETPRVPGTERRLWVRYRCDLEINCQPAHQPDSPRLPARIHDISRGGVSLVLSTPFPVGTVLSIELPGSSVRESTALLACVLHVGERPDGRHRLGCTFVTELNDDDLKPFGARRLRTSQADQRRFVRFPCSLPATYRLVRVTERKPALTKAVDLSAMGVGLLAARPIAVGTVLQVELRTAKGEAALRMLACVVRVTARGENEWLLGCNFIRQICDKEMTSLLEKEA